MVLPSEGGGEPLDESRRERGERSSDEERPRSRGGFLSGVGIEDRHDHVVVGCSAKRSEQGSMSPRALAEPERPTDLADVDHYVLSALVDPAIEVSEQPRRRGA